MGFSVIDYVIIGLYLFGITALGSVIGGKQHTSHDYFLAGKKMSWWAVGLSIVASETSTLTFISVPGLAYRGNLHFLQLAFGYLIGRLLVSALFIPAYYRGNLETAYDFLGKRFGLSLRKWTSTVFIVTRVLASAVRLFAAAIPIHIITGLGYFESILIIGLCTLLYTYLGGLKAVVAMDVVQLFVYLTGAIASIFLIVQYLPHSWDDVVRYATSGAQNKFEIFNPAAGNTLAGFLSSPYTFAGSLLGGAFLSMASHGTDQLLVQRLLSCRSTRDSQRALILDAIVIVFQFALFLLLGLCLFAFYNGAPFEQMNLKSSDEVFLKFITTSLPSGLAGLVIAGVLASAMGTLSSSINSLASSTFLDLFKGSNRGKTMDAKEGLAWSRGFTLFWGLVLTGGAMLFADTTDPVIELGLKIASFTYGGLLGTFFLGLLSRRVGKVDAFVGLFAGLLAMAAVLFITKIDFTWHTLIGCIVTVVTGNVTRFIRKFMTPQLST